jgi:hypothetical protein
MTVTKNTLVKLVPTCVIVLLAMTLSLLLHSYESRHQALLLEGNRLYGSQAVLVDETPRVLLDSLKELGQNVRVFSLLADYDKVRVVAANDFEKIPFPIHQGKGFSNDDRREALVGAGVGIEYDNEKPYVTLGSRRYEVVGFLGTRADSVLEQDVLLKDDELFCSASASSVVLDGTGAETAYKRLIPTAKTEAFNFGVDRRTSIDSVSPVLFGAGVMLIIAGYVCAGFLYGLQKVEEVRIFDLLGYSRWRAYRNQWALLVILAGCALLSSTLLCAAASPLHPPTFDVIVLSGVTAIVLVGSASMAPVLIKGKA